MVHLLGPALKYAHRKTRHGMDAVRLGNVEIVRKNLFRLHDDKLLITQGALTRIVNILTAAGVPYEYHDLRPVTQLEADIKHLQACIPDLQFRIGQEHVLAHIMGYDNGVFIAPTAWGKTFVITAAAALYPHANIIVTSPSASLLDSTFRRMLKITSEVGRVGGGYRDPQRVTLATYQSLERAPTDRCDILLIDEVHKVAGPKISETIARIRAPVKIFGLTASLHGRADGAEPLVEALVGPVIYQLDYNTAAEAGAVANMKVMMVNITEEMCPIRTAGYKTRVARKRNGYWRNTYRNGIMAEAVLEIPRRLGIDDPQVLILCETIEHALRMKKLLPDFEVVYGSMSKDRIQKMAQLKLVPEDYKALTPKQKTQMLTDFEAGRLRRVIATGCWGEGIDPVHLNIVVNLSGSPSPIINTQWSGRASRITPDGKKQFGVVIDSMDRWDSWALRRAQERQRTYKKHKWEVIKLNRPEDVKEIVA
jgi:superfamily II DNA or RNA helicase